MYDLGIHSAKESEWIILPSFHRWKSDSEKRDSQCDCWMGTKLVPEVCQEDNGGKLPGILPRRRVRMVLKSPRWHFVYNFVCIVYSRLNMSVFRPTHGNDFLTIIPRARVGYELAITKLVSNKREWNGCFINFFNSRGLDIIGPLGSFSVESAQNLVFFSHLICPMGCFLAYQH